MRPKKKFVVAITGVAKQTAGISEGKTFQTKVNIVTYLSLVLSCYDMQEAVGLAIGYFSQKNPNHIVFQHAEQEI